MALAKHLNSKKEPYTVFGWNVVTFFETSTCSEGLNEAVGCFSEGLSEGPLGHASKKWGARTTNKNVL